MGTTQCSMRACARQLATVVTVDGDIDASNVQEVTQYATRYVLAEKPFVLDLSAVNTISPHGISLIFALDDKCDAAGLEWELVANPAILDAIGHDVDHTTLPVSGSVARALAHFADVTRRRRRLLPALPKSA
jgi:anti-anti-sigma regulatory factor